MCDFQDFPHRNYLELEFTKLDETIILCPLHLPCRECKKFSIIQDVDTNSKFYKKEVELWKYEKEKDSMLSKIESDKSLYKKVKANVVAKK